jgi:RNA polymerase sigma factor (sigma-70 family)
MRTDDGSIIQDCLNGESEAFGILVDKYKAGIYAYAYAKLRDFQDAQDVTQEVFIQAYSNLYKLRRWESFSFWIYRMASNFCKKLIQNQINRPDLKHIDELDTMSLETSSVNSYQKDKLCESVCEALDSLPENYREILMLFYFAGMNNKEIANALGISSTAIRMRLSRAREMLREEMIDMMDTAFEGQRLQANFTFRIVEAIKHIKIHPISTIKGLPWGLSLATGLIIAIMSFNPNLGQLMTFDTLAGVPLPVETKVLKSGEIPVDTIKVSQLPIISSKIGKSNGEKPSYQNAILMAPKAEGGTWTRKADIPIGVGYHSISAIDGKIYVIGGAQEGFHLNIKPLSTVYEYDPNANTWSKKADIPTNRMTQRSCVVDGKIYVIGGWTDGGFTSAVEAYDSATDKWEKKTNISTKRAEFAIGVVNGKIYVIGGHSGPDPQPALSIVEVYDPKTDTWTKKADMPTARSFITGSVVNNKIYVFGGADTNGVAGPIKFLSTVEIYDPSTDTWTKGSDMPGPNVMLASCTVNGMIYIIGGQDYNNILSSVEIYDPANDTWLKGINIPIERCSVSNYPVIDGKIYCIGGINFNGCRSDVWEYTPEILQSIVSAQGKLPNTWGNIKSK